MNPEKPEALLEMNYRSYRGHRSAEYSPFTIAMQMFATGCKRTR
jgi:hypothetical protein